MRNLLVWKSMRRLAPLVACAAALASSTALHAQTKPGSANEGLHLTPPPLALNDPTVKQCLLLAGRRTDPKLDSVTTEVDMAAAMFDLKVVFDAVATCRAALAAYPNEPKVIIAAYNAGDALSVMALGMKFPDSEEAQLFLALQAANKDGNATGLGAQLTGFFLGSAYEYGVGTKPDRAAAMNWYAIAAADGDPISKRELLRLQSIK